MRTAILGATRGMGRALARLLAQRGEALCLLGRSPDELERSARDLELRGAERVSCAVCDLDQVETLEPALARATEELAGLDCVVVTAGLFAGQERLEADPEHLERLLSTNFTRTVRFCEAARRALLAGGGGTLCVFSSVAGDRARASNRLYGATKAGLSHYLEGLDHGYRREGLVTVAVKPGFVRTGMTAGLKPPPFAGDPEAVARRVARAIDAGRPVVYAPGIWSALSALLSRLPRFAMRRVRF